MQQQHQANRDRLDECLTALQDTKDMKAKSSLWKFYENCRRTWIELDKEMVECRRRQRVTHKYTELQAQFDEYVKHFEQWIIMAKLMY
jgi:translation initiation factor 2 beta subunit (eIF-2beta)/eIF-5